MTTLCFDGRTLGADRQMNGGFNVPKVFRLKDGRYAAGCGDYDAMTEIIHWIDQGENREEMPSLPEKDEDGEAPAEVIVVSARGVVYWVTWPYLRLQRLTEKKIALGSGGEYAMGALAMGATTQTALKIAHRFDPHTGKGFDCVRVVKEGSP